MPQPSRHAVIYARISNDKVGAGLGVARQEKDCRELAARLGATVAATFTDNDTSAYSGALRPGYEAMLAALEAGEASLVLAWHTDRLHRSPAELERYIDVCDPRGVVTHTVTAGELDLATATGRMAARIYGAVARHESEQKSERQKAKHLQLAEMGFPSGGGTRAFGFAEDRRTLIPEEAVIIREAASRILRGEALSSVAKDLNRRGVRTPAGNQWWTMSLKRVLVSARIAGQREHRPRTRKETKRALLGEITAKGQWEAIITPEESALLRRTLTDPGRRLSTPPTGKYPLSGGVLVCGECGCRMVGRPGSDKRRRYMCDRGPGRPGCGRVRILACFIEDYVFSLAAATMASPEFARMLAESGQPAERELMEAIRADENELEELARDHGNGDISRREWLAARKPIQARIEAARSKLARGERVRVVEDIPGSYEELLEYFTDEGWSVSRRRAVLGAVVGQVTVHRAVKGLNKFRPDDPCPVHPEHRRVEIVWRA